MSTGLIFLSAESFSSRSLACCSTAMTNASWTWLFSESSLAERQRTLLLIQWHRVCVCVCVASSQDPGVYLKRTSLSSFRQYWSTLYAACYFIRPDAKIGEIHSSKDSKEKFASKHKLHGRNVLFTFLVFRFDLPRPRFVLGPPTI